MTYEPEIALFSPAPTTPRETISTPSTAFRGSPSILDHSPSHWQSIALPTGAIRTDETSVVRQVSLKQRSARLSFLPGRRQQDHEQSGHTDKAADTPEFKISHSRSRSFGKGNRRQNVFRSRSEDDGSQETTHADGAGRRQSPASKVSLDASRSGEEYLPEKDAPMAKRSVGMKKRLSLLKIGMKSSKRRGVMGSVDEE